MKLIIYLDTSVISARFDDKHPDRQALTESFFAQLSDFEVYISDLTLDEMMATQNPQLREKMLDCVATLTVLQKTQEATLLVNDLLQNNAVPQKSIEDAYHIAIAVVAGMDYLLSWNFRHLVRLKTQDTVRMITTLRGYKPITIIAPPQLL